MVYPVTFHYTCGNCTSLTNCTNNQCMFSIPTDPQYSKVMPYESCNLYSVCNSMTNITRVIEECTQQTSMQVVSPCNTGCCAKSARPGSVFTDPLCLSKVQCDHYRSFANKSLLSQSMIALIVIGAVIVIFLILGTVIYCLNKSRPPTQKTQKANQKKISTDESLTADNNKNWLHKQKHDSMINFSTAGDEVPAQTQEREKIIYPIIMNRPQTVQLFDDTAQYNL